MAQQQERSTRANKDYAIDFGQWLPDGDSLTDYSLSVSPAGLALDDPRNGIVGTAIVFWSTGGTSGVNYTIGCEIETAAGRKEYAEIFMLVK